MKKVMAIALAISGRIMDPLSSLRVGISQCSTNFPFEEKNPILTVVPPISTPNAYGFIKEFPPIPLIDWRVHPSGLPDRPAGTHSI